LGKTVYDITHRELDLGLVGLVQFLPVAVFVVLAGGVADRFDKRRIGSIVLGAEALLTIGFVAYLRTGPTSIAPILVLAALFGTCRAFAAPSVRSLPAYVVPARDLPRMIALNSLAFQSALIAGPALAGLLFTAGSTWPYWLSFSLYLVGAALLFRVRLQPATASVAPTAAALASPRPRLRDALEGLHVIRENPLLLGAISLDLFAVLFGGAVALLPAIAEDRLHVGALGFGWLRAATGIGAALTGILIATRPISRHVGRSLLVAVAVFGLATVILGVTRSYVVAFVSLMILSGADAVSVFIRSTISPLVVPAHARGRVLAVENVFIGASNELGAFESGVAGQLLGVANAVTLGGVATVGIAGAWWLLFPRLRSIDRFDELHA
jgi:predicted MFS family arabinose efflux permease